MSKAFENKVKLNDFVSVKDFGPLGYGYTRDLNTPTGNTKAYFTYTGGTSGYTYITGIWVLPKSWVCTVSGSPGTWVSEGNL